MADKISISIALHPLAWKLLRQQYRYDGTAVDLGNGWLYTLIVQGLKRRPILGAAEIRHPTPFEKGSIYITQRDYLHHGDYLPLHLQAKISLSIYRHELHAICQQVALIHVATGIARNIIMRQILEDHHLEEEDIKFGTLKKHYQRNYRQKEPYISQSINQMKQ